MNNLTALNTNNNSFAGPMHFLFATIPSLVVLDICHNEFSITVPHELFRATSLECLSFRNNNLHGLLDGSNIVELGNLGFLDLGSNWLRCEVPYSIG